MTTTSPSSRIRRVIDRLVKETYLFSTVVDTEDLAQVARLAAWRATASFSPAEGASLSSYTTSAIRRAVHDEANRFHDIFTFPSKAKRAGVNRIKSVQHEPLCDSDTELHHYVDLEALTDLERAIVARWLNGYRAEEVAAAQGIPLSTFYREERHLRRRIEKEVLHA